MPVPPGLRLKRLHHRSRYRGVLESDLILGRFADLHLGRLDPGQLDRYEALLGESDQDLLAWIAGSMPPPAAHDNDVLALLREIHFRPAAQGDPDSPAGYVP
jgi:antitoxin CptB